MAKAKKKVTKKKVAKKRIGQHRVLTPKDYMDLVPCYNIESVDPSLTGQSGEISQILTYETFPLSHRVYAILKVLDDDFRRRYFINVARAILKTIKEKFDPAIYDCLDVAEKASKGKATQAELQVSRTHAMEIAKEMKSLECRTAMILVAKACFFGAAAERGVFNYETKDVQLKVLKKMLGDEDICSEHCLKKHFSGL